MNSADLASTIDRLINVVYLGFGFVKRDGTSNCFRSTPKGLLLNTHQETKKCSIQCKCSLVPNTKYPTL